MSSFSKFSDLILAFIFPPIVGFLSGFLFLFYREIFSFRFYDILNKKDGLIPPSDYGSLSSTTAIIVAAMFPVALYVIEKRSDLKYFEEKLDEIFSRNHDEAIENILNYNKGIGEEILHQDQSLKFGIKIFILVSFLSSIFAAALVFLWGPPWFLFREKYAVLLHTIIFSFFCSGIGSMYTKEFSFAFQGPFLRYANYLNNKKYFDRTLKKISLHKNINLDDLQKMQLPPGGILAKATKKKIYCHVHVFCLCLSMFLRQKYLFLPCVCRFIKFFWKKKKFLLLL